MELNELIDKIENPPEGEAVTMTMSAAKAIRYWKELAEQAAAILKEYCVDYELPEDLKDPQKVLERGQELLKTTFKVSDKIWSDFENALADLLSKKCDECGGMGTVDDADLGDIAFNTYVCPKCNGTGFKS